MPAPHLSRRILLKGLGLAATSLTLAACVSPPPSPKSPEQPPAATPKIAPPTEIWVFLSQPACPGGANADENEAVRRTILDATGVKVNTILTASTASAGEKLNLLLAAGSQQLDLFEGNWPDFKPALQPLDAVLKQFGPNILRMNAETTWKRMKDWDGVTWGYPRLGLMGMTHFPYFRTDWLAEAGLKLPETWAQLEAVIAAFKKRHPESVVAANGRLNLMMNTLGAFVETGCGNWRDGAGGQIKPVETHPGYRDWVVKMNEWWRQGWWQRETFANPDFRAMLKTLTIGVWLGWYSRITVWWEGIRQEAKYEKEDYDFSLALTGPQGLAKTNNPGGNEAYMIPRKSRAADAVIRYVDWVYQGLPDDPTHALIVLTGIEGQDWEWVDRRQRIWRSLVPATAQCENKYAGDYYQAKGMGTELSLSASVGPDGQVSRQGDHILKYAQRFDTGKMPFDYDVPYDTTLIMKQFPGLSDFNRVLEEESIKLITGVRPLTEWDTFQREIGAAGLKEWSQHHTEQYKRYHP
jgi:ABC-type glycerol-3-phosphate transport system substrate-binding protein